MNQRGRKGQGPLAVAIQPTAMVRLTPPPELSEFEAHVWTSVVNTKPADWFQADTLPLLVSYCKSVSCAATLDVKIAAFDPDWLDDDSGLLRYKRLTDMRDRESRGMTALARSMRLTQQAQYDTKTAHRASEKVTGKRPWESK